MDSHRTRQIELQQQEQKKVQAEISLEEMQEQIDTYSYARETKRYLYTVEPDVNLEGGKIWSDWHNGLKECKEYLEAEYGTARKRHYST